jgi:hypothetical protein
MPTAETSQSGLTWLVYASMTVAAWGLYGIFLHSGQTLMKDPEDGRSKAFLFVGIAYFLTAVLAPLAVLWLKGASWDFTPSGMSWSLLAGAVGAVGAYCVLLAFGAGGLPSVVMTIVFAGAPIVNAVAAILMHPPAGGWSGLRWQFVLGIVLAAVGAGLVTLYKPAPAKASSVSVSPQASAEPVRGAAWGYSSERTAPR